MVVATGTVREACVLGLDGAAVMLAIAEQRRLALVEVAPGDGGEPPRVERLRFRKALLPLEPDQALRLRAEAAGNSGDGAGFSAVVSNSLLHHLHDPAVLWGAIQTLAAPGALVVVRDLRRPMTETRLVY